MVWFVQPQADDYWYGLKARDLGWWGGLVWYYQQWNGRLLANAGQLAQTLGSDLHTGCRVACYGIGLLFSASAVAFARALAPAAGWRGHLLLGLGGVCLWLGLGSSQGGLYWLPAAWNYVTAISFALLGAAAATAGRSGWAACAGLAGGLCCESVWLPVGLLGLLGWWRLPRCGRWPWAWFLVGLILGAVIITVAPGNAHRVQAHGGWHALALAEGWRQAWFTTQALWTSPAWLAACGYAVLLRPRCRSTWPATALWTGLAPVLAFIAIMPALWVLGAVEVRVTDFSRAGPLLAGMIAAHGALAWIEQHWTRPRPRIAMALLGAGGLLTAWLIHQDPQTLGTPLGCALLAIALALRAADRPISPWLPSGVLLVALGGCLEWVVRDIQGPAPRWAEAWEKRREMLTEAARLGRTVVVLPPMPDDARPRMIFLELSPHPDRGPNADVARWFGVRRIWLDLPEDAMPTVRQAWWKQIEADARRHGCEPWRPAPLSTARTWDGR